MYVTTHKVPHFNSDTVEFASRKRDESNPGIQTPGGGGYSHTLPIRVCAAQRGRDFEAPDLERGIHFRDFC